MRSKNSIPSVKKLEANIVNFSAERLAFFIKKSRRLLSKKKYIKNTNKLYFKDSAFDNINCAIDKYKQTIILCEVELKNRGINYEDTSRK